MYGRVLNPLFGSGRATLMRFGMQSNAQWSNHTIFCITLPAILVFLMHIPYLVRLERNFISSWKDALGFTLLCFICTSFVIFVGDGVGGAIYPLLILSFRHPTTIKNMI